MKYENLGKVISDRVNACRMKNILIWIALALMVVVASGCVSNLSDTTKNETITTPVATGTPIATNVTPSAGQTEFHAPAPYQLYIKTGQVYQFIYYNRNFTVYYSSAYPTQIVKITFDGYEKTIQKERYEAVSYLPSWIEGGFVITLSPVSWEIRDGQRGPVYLSTWNTTELYLEVWESK